ncbi:unnamed protein product [Natator depressus]
MWGEIIGGLEAGRHSRPYMAFVKIETGGDRNRGCRGLLMWEDMVVTAALCNCNLGTITVLLGAHSVEIDELGRQEVWVHHRILHPEFNDETDEKDLMLLQAAPEAPWSVTGRPRALSPRANLMGQHPRFSPGSPNTSRGSRKLHKLMP